MYHLMELKDGERGLSLEDSIVTPTTNGVNGNGVHKQRKSLFTQAVSLIGKGSRPSAKSSLATTNGHVNGVKSNGTNAATASNGLKPNGLTRPRTLGDLANVVRSKNAGPYEITFDLIFESREAYLKVKESGLLTKKTIARAYSLAESDILWCGYFDPAQAFKATIPRIRAGKRRAGGGFMENDVHGSQQHLALVNIKLPEELVEDLVTWLD